MKNKAYLRSRLMRETIMTQRRDLRDCLHDTGMIFISRMSSFYLHVFFA